MLSVTVPNIMHFAQSHLKPDQEYSTEHLKNSPVIWESVIWWDESKIESSTYAIPHLKQTWQHDAMWLFLFHWSLGCLWVQSTRDNTGYIEILEENLFNFVINLKIGKKFTYQQDKNQKHTSQAILKIVLEEKSEIYGLIENFHIPLEVLMWLPLCRSQIRTSSGIWKLLSIQCHQ